MNLNITTERRFAMLQACKIETIVGTKHPLNYKLITRMQDTMSYENITRLSVLYSAAVRYVQCNKIRDVKFFATLT